MEESEKSMNEVLKCIESRRSVKSFKDEAVDKSIIEKIINAGLKAPSGMNRQSAIVVAVTDKKLAMRSHAQTPK